MKCVASLSGRNGRRLLTAHNRRPETITMEFHRLLFYYYYYYHFLLLSFFLSFFSYCGEGGRREKGGGGLERTLGSFIHSLIDCLVVAMLLLFGIPGHIHEDIFFFFHNSLTFSTPRFELLG